MHTPLVPPGPHQRVVWLQVFGTGVGGLSSGSAQDRMRGMRAATVMAVMGDREGGGVGRVVRSEIVVSRR